MVHSDDLISKLLARNPQDTKCESWQIQLNASHDEIAQQSFSSDFSTNGQAREGWSRKYSKCVHIQPEAGDKYSAHYTFVR